jgi:FAD/FMN-containing dehydrogenase
MGAVIERVQGPVFRPGENDFDEERSGFQIAHRHRPDLVVAATGPDDVRAAVAYAAEHGLPVAVQATGHGLGVPLDGGVLISTRRMTRVTIDPAARTARVAAGVRWQQVVDAAARHGLAPLSGSSPSVGAVGYTLGGGLGLLARTYGWAIDRVRSVELVAPDGQAVTADPTPALFQDLRGGAGVVTAMEIGLVPVTRLYGGGLYVDTAHVAALLEAYREWTADLPDELTTSVGLIPYPDIDVVPEPLRGRYVAHVRIAFDGPAAEGERLVAPLRAAVPLLRDTLGELDYTDSASIHNDPRQPHAYTGTNALLRALDPAALRAVIELTGPQAPLPCIVQINHLGGALRRPSAVPDAGPHREAAHLLRVVSVLDGTGRQLPAHRALMDAVAPWSLGRSPNFVLGPQDEQPS